MPLSRLGIERSHELSRNEVEQLHGDLGLAAVGLPEDICLQASWSLVPDAIERKMGSYLLQLGPLSSRGVGLVLEGICGSGKSTILALIAAAVRQRWGSIFFPPPGEQRVGYTDRLRVVYRPMTDLMDFLLQRNQSESWEHEWMTLMRAQHLLLDEVGTQYSEPFGAQRLFRLLDARLQSARCTHMAGNDQIEQLQDDPVGYRIYQRLKAKAHIIALPNIDHRQPRALGELDCSGWEA